MVWPAAPAPARARPLARPPSRRDRPPAEADAETLGRLAALDLAYPMPTPLRAEGAQCLADAPLRLLPTARAPDARAPAAAGKRIGDAGARKRRAEERNMGEQRMLKISQRPRTHQWGEGRYWQGAAEIRRLEELRHPPITRDQGDLARALLHKAATQAGGKACFARMPTASARLWGVACCLEAFARLNPGGYVVGSKAGADARSWEHLESLQERRCEAALAEDRAATHRFRPGSYATTQLVRRTPGAHSFGGAKEKFKKIRCLDALLREAGDSGLHYEVLTLRAPTIIQLAHPDFFTEPQCAAGTAARA